MSIMRLIPSDYYVSSSYLTVSNEEDMYSNTDSTTHATITNTRSGTSSYYIYLRGFNFDDLPNNATINSFTVKLKANESGVSTSTSYEPYLANGTSAINGSCSPITTTVTTHTFSGISASWETISGYGNNFGIRINCRRASRNTTGYVYIYGAEIEVDYTAANPRTVTSSLNGDGTIDPSGVYNTYKDEEYTITITPANKADSVSMTLNGVDVTSSLVAHGGVGGTIDTNLGNYTLISGSFNGSGASYFSGLEGNGVDASRTTSNYYSGGSSVRAVFRYDMGIDLPSNAVIERVYCEVNGHAESTSQSSEYMCVQLVSGNTDISEQINFKSVSTSNTTITLEPETLPTVAQLSDIALECTLGYYGGAINGATLYVEYIVPSGNPDYYTYTYIVNDNAVIVVTVGSAQLSVISFKQNGAWVAASKVYKKVNGSWIEQSDLSTVFDSSINYVLR